ncbi:MAG: transposase family protein [Treponema sp.]|nr:transposase family protein [Treponema sp.]
MKYIAGCPAFKITLEIAEKLKTIRSASIDRYLKKDKEALIFKEKSLTKSLDFQKSRIPFLVLEFHSDNGSEFINNATELWCKQESLPFTRNHDHKKNDNCFRGTKKRRGSP